MTRLWMATTALLVATACATLPPQGDVQRASGRLTSLRVHDVGAQDSLSDDRRELEVMIQLDGEPDKVFGFQLRMDRHQAARQGMLDLLRDAFAHDWTVTIGYISEPGRDAGVIVRTWLKRQPRTSDPVRVIEVPQLPKTADDPILRGERVDPELVLDQLPDPPAELSGKGAHDAMGETEWTFVEEVELDPGEAQEKTVSFDEPVLLQARATWFGALVPVEMTVTMDGTTLATGRAHPSPANRGTITADVQIDSPGSASVSVVNKGSVPVGVEMVIGVLPVSLGP